MQPALFAWWPSKCRAFSPRRGARGIGRAGGVALLSAMCAPVLIMIVGFAADYGYASYLNLRLSRATDAATLASVSQTAATAAGLSGYSNFSFLETYGTNLFNANIAQLPVSGVNFSLSVASDGFNGVVAAGSYTYNVPTFFAGVLGFNVIPISGSAKTAARPEVFMTYYLLVDASQSMGIGATQADMTALYNRVVTYGNAASNDRGCVFGCHVKQQLNGGLQKYTNEDLAHNSAYGTPLTLRIDSAVSAITSIINSAANIAGTTKNIKFGIYTITQDPTTGKEVQPVADPPSTNYASLATAAASIDLGNINSNTTGTTDFRGEISTFLNGLSPPLTQGSGVSATSPRNYVFLVTDGMNDVPGNCSVYSVCVTPLDASYCNALKNNATVGVIYTTYAPIYQFNTAPTLEARYAALVDGKPTQAKANLQSCATSANWFFEAQDGPAIVQAMQTLFKQTLPVSARIYQ